MYIINIMTIKVHKKRWILNRIANQLMLLLGSVIVVSKTKILIVSSVAITLVSIRIVMLNTLRLVLNA